MKIIQDYLENTKTNKAISPLRMLCNDISDIGNQNLKRFDISVYDAFCNLIFMLSISIPHISETQMQ